MHLSVRVLLSAEDPRSWLIRFDVRIGSREAFKALLLRTPCRRITRRQLALVHAAKPVIAIVSDGGVSKEITLISVLVEVCSACSRRVTA